jgi:hypothetical protein
MLTTLLQSFYHKSQRVNLQKGIQIIGPEESHALELPFDADKLEEIFEKSRYLLSDDLITKYMEYLVIRFDLLNKKYKELVRFPA